MKAFCLVICLAALLAAPTLAQDKPKVELFAGYSLMIRDVSGLFGPQDTESRHGWNASVAGNLSGWLGLVGDFSGHYGSFSGSPGKQRVHTYLFGPRLSFRKSERVTPFAHLLFGGEHSSIRGNAFPFSGSAFALSAGGGLDVRANARIALRVLQYDAVIVPAGLSGHHRFSFGVVFKLGLL